jgi:type I restriction enzyme S subunit
VKMKDSGIEWIGEIPETWKVTPLYMYFTERRNKNRLGKEKNLLSLSYGHIVQKNIEAKGGLLPESFTTYNIIEPGDIIIRPTDLQNDKRSLRTGLSNEHGIITSAYIDLEPLKNVNSKYYHYLLHSYDIQKVFYNMGNGVRQGLNYSEFSKLRVLAPESIEQQQIADFLDHKTAEIDGLIDKINTEIDILKQYQSSVITRTVTKGLDPSVPMKDSGIKTVGTIPTKWKIGRIKYVAKIFGRIGFRGYTNADLVGEKEGAISLSPGNLSNGKLDLNKCAYLSWKKYYESPEIMINEHDIIIVKTGSSFGKIAWVDTIDHEMTLNPQLVVLKNIKISKKFLFYALGTPLFKRQAEETVVGGTIPTMSQTSISNFKIVLPSKSEQQKIVDYLDQKVSQIQKIIESKQQQINQLIEYKNSLIFEYVTGKKQVKEAN